MLNINKKTLIFVIFDGIKNSVFQSQVLTPLLNKLDEELNLNIKIVSFEKDVTAAQKFAQNLPCNERLDFIFFKRKPFWGKLSLIRPARYFRSFLKNSQADQVIARGPLAGYVVLMGLDKKQAIDITVQARGLCAEEYRYTTQKTRNFFRRFWNKFIFKSLEKIEKYVYGSDKIKVEAVSPALKDYLVKHFNVEHANIFIALKDIPKHVDKYQAVVWRGQVRDELNIPEDATVYCYSGSFKPWQCAEQTIESFAFEFFKNPSIFMLVLSQDSKPFKNALEKFKIPKSNYRILSVQPNELNKYLCAANFGILLRESDIINWVSRPTKMLEYQACGLQIIHNNTIAWLAQK